MPAPIELTLYDAENEPIKTLRRMIVPWGLGKRAIRMMKQINGDPENLTEEMYDELTDITVEVFGEDKVSREELEKHSDMADMFAVLLMIFNRAKGVVPNAPPPAKK